jgi:hypothetical protein
VVAQQQQHQQSVAAGSEWLTVHAAHPQTLDEVVGAVPLRHDAQMPRLVSAWLPAPPSQDALQSDHVSQIQLLLLLLRLCPRQQQRGGGQRAGLQDSQSDLLLLLLLRRLWRQ